MKSVLSIFSLLFATCSIAHASNIEKIYDGHISYCSNQILDTISDQKSVYLGFNEETNLLKVTIVKCTQGKWAKDLSPSLSTYKSDIGENVKVSFSDFNLVLVNEQTNEVKKIPLKNLEDFGSETIELKKYLKFNSNETFEAFVTAKKKVISLESGYNFEENFAFGSYRLSL